VRGEEVTLTAGAQSWKGRVNGKALELH